MAVYDETTIKQADAPGNIARSWMDFFRLFGFGALPPKVEVEITPTIQLDDNSKGPFPVYRPCSGSLNKGPTALQWTEFEIVNADAPESRSALVIDYIIYQLGAAANVVHGMSTPFPGLDSTFLAQNGLLLFDQGAERDQPPINANDPAGGGVGAARQGARIATQGIWGRTVAVQTLVEGVNATLLPSGEATASFTPHRIDGPWIIGPGSALFIGPDIVNVSMRIYVRGRYYPGRYTTL